MNNFVRIIKYGWMGFWRNIWVSVATIGIMVLALSVVSSLLIVGNITDTFVKEVQGKVDVSVYLSEEADEAKIAQLRSLLRAREDIREVEYISRDDALALFKERHKDSEFLMASLAELGANPFQGSLNIKAQKASQFDAIVSFIEGYEGAEIVDKINFKENEKVIQKLNNITSSIENIGLFFTFALSLVVVLITFNTIRLVIYTYRDEISVMKIVGASDWFIRGPFIFTGFLYGAISAVITYLAFLFVVWIISAKTGAVFPGTDILAYWAANSFGIFMLLVAFGAGLGVFSSFIAIGRYLKV
ncbi:MAG: permease-like cell division protein FtsX [Candidatus Spechtbacterales bacterium]